MERGSARCCNFWLYLCSRVKAAILVPGAICWLHCEIHLTPHPRLSQQGITLESILTPSPPVCSGPSTGSWETWRDDVLTKPHSTAAVVLCFSLEGLKALEKRVILAGKDLIPLSWGVHLLYKEIWMFSCSMPLHPLFSSPSPNTVDVLYLLCCC